MTLLPVLPILLPAVVAAMLISAWRQPGVQRIVGVAGLAAHLVAAGALFATVADQGVVALYVGGWAAPFGITLVADLLSATLVLLTGVLALVIGVYALGDIDADRQRFGFFPLLHVLIMGISGAFLTGDLFNLYVWFEVMLIASFVLLALGGERLQLEGALKYVTLNLLSSALFLAAIGLTYGATKTLNMADLSLKMAELRQSDPGLTLALAALLIICFGIKAAVFPLFFWLPASYPTPPTAVSAIFAGLLTKVGVYSLVRVFTLIFPADERVLTLIVVLATLTMLTGVFGAVAQFEFRRILSFHSISQIGYMVLGLGLLLAPHEAARALGLAAALVYMIHHSLVKSNLFLISGAVAALRGTFELKPLGGLALRTPLLAALFLIVALSLAGLPPSSGFWAKLAVVRAGLDAGQYIAVAAALFTGLLTLISMIKIWNEAFWKAAPEGDALVLAPLSPGQRVTRLAPVLVLTLLAVAIGLYPAPLLAVADQAAAQLLDPEVYRAAVFGAADTVPPEIALR